MDNSGFNNAVPNGTNLEKPMSMGEWLITMIVLAIPCVGIIMMFVWGFGTGNTSRKNYCRAMLIFALIGVVLSVIFYGSIAAMMASALNV